MVVDTFKTKAALEEVLLEGVKAQTIESEKLDELEVLLMSSCDQMAFSRFFQDMEIRMLLKIDILQKYLKQNLGEQYNLSTVISEICNQEKQNIHILDMINNLATIEGLNNQKIVILSPDHSTEIKGKISQAGRHGDHIYFNLVDPGNTDHKISLTSTKAYIEKVLVETQRKYLFKDWIFGIQSQIIGKPIVKENQLVKINHKELTCPANILTDGKYTIELRFSLRKTLERIIFISSINNRKQFIVQKDQDQDPQISCDELQAPIFLKDFEKYLYIVEPEIMGFRYQSLEESNICLRIIQHNQNQAQLSIVETMKGITRLKTETIELLKQDKFHAISVDLLNLFITSDTSYKHTSLQKIMAQREFDVINEKLKQVQKLERKLKNNRKVEEILLEIVVQTNYSMLVQKKEAVNNVRILNLMVDAEKSLSLVGGKSLIAFYGTTGSGKSTSVNYFMGVPLKLQKDKYGGRIVKIDEKQYSKLNCTNEGTNEAKIGHKIGTSETLYAQGHEFIESEMSKNLKEMLKDVVLCDNPGFDDTRGTELEIITGMSIDMAVEKSNNILAIVLVIPYPSFTNDRSKNVFSLLGTMMERFPDLLKVQTATHKSFHILITKWDNNDQVNSFETRIKNMISEQQEVIMSKERDDLYFGDTLGKLDVLKILLKMFKGGRIRFMYPTNNVQKTKLLTSYLASDSIPKSSYKGFMESGRLKQYFNNHLSTSAHSWTTLLLYPFTTLIPQRIKQCKARLLELEKGKINRAETITNLKNENISSKEKIATYKKQLSNVKDMLLGDQNPNSSQANLLISNQNIIDNINKRIESLQQRVKLNKVNVQKKQKEISLKQTALRGLMDAQIKQDKLNSNLSKKIEQLKHGYTDQQLYSYIPILRQVMLLSLNRSEEEAKRAFQNFEVLKPTTQVENFIMGSRYQKMYIQPVIQKQYVIIPNQEFDPNSYIQAYNQKERFSHNDYKAKIQSRHSNLEKINTAQSGRKIVLKINFTFNKCTRQEDLPFLRITHSIPNEQKNSAEIKNKEAELEKGQREIKRLKNEVSSAETEMAALIKEKGVFENIIKQTTEALSKEQNGAQKAVEGFYANAIKAEEKSIKSNLDKIAEFQKIKGSNVTDKSIQEQKYETYKFVYRRIAFLIKDQMNKQIPLSLAEFIKKAQREAGKYDKSDKKNAHLVNQNEVFDHFLALFEKETNTIEKKISQVLRSKQLEMVGNALPYLNMNKDIQQQITGKIDEIQKSLKKRAPQSPLKPLNPLKPKDPYDYFQRSEYQWREIVEEPNIQGQLDFSFVINPEQQNPSPTKPKQAGPPAHTNPPIRPMPKIVSKQTTKCPCCSLI